MDWVYWVLVWEAVGVMVWLNPFVDLRQELTNPWRMAGEFVSPVVRAVGRISGVVGILFMLTMWPVIVAVAGLTFVQTLLRKEGGND